MTATVRLEWDMGHRLPNHDGACRNFHGHRYVAEVSFRAPVKTDMGAPDEGMVMDFKHIKDIAKPIIESSFDHKMMLCQRDPWASEDFPGLVVVPFVPTAECIAAHLLSLLIQEDIARNGKRHVFSVKLWETPTSYVEATWNGE